MWYQYDLTKNAPEFQIVKLLAEWTIAANRDVIRYQMGYNRERDFVLNSTGKVYHVKTVYYQDGRIPQSNVVHVHPTRW